MKTITKENTNIQFDITSITIEPIKTLTNVGIPTISYAELKSFLLGCKARGEKLNYQFVNVTMTPKAARDLLDTFKSNNRQESAGWIKSLSKQMATGDFDEQIGDAVTFDVDANYIEGFHRMYGLTLAPDGTVITMTVCLGANRSAHTDITKRRNPFDNLMLSGKINEKTAKILTKEFQQMTNVVFDIYQKGDNFEKVRASINAVENGYDIIATFVNALEPIAVNTRGYDFYSCIQKSPAFRMGLLEAFLNGEIDSQDVKALYEAAGCYDLGVARFGLPGWLKPVQRDDFKANFHQMEVAFNSKNTLHSLFDVIRDIKSGGGAGVNKKTYLLTRLAIRDMKADVTIVNPKDDENVANAMKEFAKSEKAHFMNTEDYILDSMESGAVQVVRKVGKEHVG